MTDPKQMPERIYAWENMNGDCWWASEDVVEMHCDGAGWYIRADLAPKVDVEAMIEEIAMEARVWAGYEFANGTLGAPFSGPAKFDAALRHILRAHLQPYDE